MKKEWLVKTLDLCVIVLFINCGVASAFIGDNPTNDQTNLSTLEDFNFDIIYINDIYTELCYGCGITTIYSFCLIANTGSITITETDLLNIKINISSDIEGAELSIYANVEGKQIEPSQVAGTITEENQLLTDFLEIGETLVNWVPTQTIFFMIDRKNYTGNASFNITIDIRGKIAYLQTNVNFQNGDDHYVEYLSGERKSSNSQPNSPVITGPARGFPFIPYRFTFNSTDSENDFISYYIDWGDGTNIGWSPKYPSGAEVTRNHIWTKKETYIIKAKAKDWDGLESPWTEYSFSTPRNIASYNNLFLRYLEQFPILKRLLQTHTHSTF